MGRLAVRHCLPHVKGRAACLLEENQAVRMSRLSERIVQRLRTEAVVWDRARTRESDREVTARLGEAQVFKISRPAREPVSVRLDPQDIFLRSEEHTSELQ